MVLVSVPFTYILNRIRDRLASVGLTKQTNTTNDKEKQESNDSCLVENLD